MVCPWDGIDNRPKSGHLSPTKDKCYHDVNDADQYFITRPDLLPRAVGILN